MREPPMLLRTWRRDRLETPSDRNHQHLHHNGRSPRPHLTLLLPRLCCIPRPAPAHCKTPARFVVVIVDANILTYHSPTRALAPHHAPNTNPDPPYPSTGRRAPDCATRTSRLKLGQRSHYRFQHWHRCDRAPLRSTGLDALPALQKDETTAERLAERRPTTGDEPFPFMYHQTILRRYPVGCFSQVNIRLPSIPIGSGRLDTIRSCISFITSTLLYVFALRGDGVVDALRWSRVGLCSWQVCNSYNVAGLLGRTALFLLLFLLAELCQSLIKSGTLEISIGTDKNADTTYGFEGFRGDKYSVKRRVGQIRNLTFKSSRLGL